MSASRAVVAGWSLLVIAGCGDRGIAFPPDAGAWPGAAVPAWAAEPRIVVIDSGDDTLTFVSRDLPQPRVLGVVTIGDIPVELEGPHHVAASPDGRFLYVPLSNYVPGSGSGLHGEHGLGTVPGSVLKLRADDGSRVAEATVDRSPGDILLSRDGSTAWITHFDQLRVIAQSAGGLPESRGWSSLAVLDTASMAPPPLRPICATPHGEAVSGDERTLYTACAYGDQLAIVDLGGNGVERLPVGPMPGPPGAPNYMPNSVVRSPRDGSIWISCMKSGELRVYDAAAGRIDEARTLRFNGMPMFGAFLADGATLLLPHQGDEQLSIIDTAQAREVDAIPLPPAACLNSHSVVVAPGDRIAWLVCEGDHRSRPGSLVALDVEARAVLGFVEVGMFPDAALLLPPAP